MKESTARYRKAKAEVDRLTAEISRIETRLAGVDQQQEALRSMATKGAVALYMYDATGDWAGGFGDGGEQVLEAARRARLIGGVNQLAASAVKNLDDATKQIDEDRRRLRDKRKEHESALAALDGDRQAATGRFSALVAAERSEARQRRAEEAAQLKGEAEARAAQRKAEAAARAAQRTSRGQAVGRDLPAGGQPLGFVCPMSGPFKWGDGWGSGRGHKGTDMLAPRGAEQVAVVPGTLETKFWGGGGLTLFLFGDDGNTYVYMHLMRVVGDAGRRVEQGEVIGLTGASGNASAYHLHFEYHPGGGGPVDVYPMLLKACPPMPRDH